MSGTRPPYRSMLAAAAVLVALAFAPATRAETPTTTDQIRSYAALIKMKPMEVMHMCDGDKKGYVTREEFTKFHQEIFQKIDRDHDGKLSAAEWMGK